MANIIRVEHSRERPYLTLSVATIKALRADWQALGLLVFILAKPDGWRVRPEEMGKECGVGRTTIYKVLARLIELGYVKRFDTTRRLEHGHFERRTHYTVFEDKSQAVLFTAKDEQKAQEQDVRVAGQIVPF